MIPKQALNEAFLKIKSNRSDIDKFKLQLTQLLEHINEQESEEFHKNLVANFLQKTYYEPNHFINTKGRNDLVIHNDKKPNSTVGVIIELKRPTNKTEMLQQDDINKKALQELVLYYLRERISANNLEIKHLIITNVNEWFIFDANWFEKEFVQSLSKQFIEFDAGRLAGTTTDFFYTEIAKPAIALAPVEFTYFDLRTYDLTKENSELIYLFKLLSPEHLLKLPFVNDSNSLDKNFYAELLHIIGLQEVKKGGKKLIQPNNNSGSLMENIMVELRNSEKLERLAEPEQFGITETERLFNIGLELVIIWINRILFLKLLEAQLISYHADTSYAFLNLGQIKNFHDLNSLFFQVLARKVDDRDKAVKFAKVPYLNSSLFEPAEIEHNTLFISQLANKKLAIFTATVLKDSSGKKRTGELDTLEYLFEFLNAYDFASEGAGKIQEENKSLINASVLGLIFEKINGYKDGSFFTPGFITMYMCRETIRRAVVQKFNERKAWDCKDIDDLYDRIEDRQEANAIINALKICDPAVGSGHFLVSALNEIVAIKHDLRILQDRAGRRLKEYQVKVVNDELIVKDEDGELFEYNPQSLESQRVQEALFHEKQTIIENCLFGVDINVNSVKICRLRLWIELLKHAFYKADGELETLPNIDINIKCGNSLISRFELDVDLSAILRRSKWSIEGYREAVATYRNAESKEQKHDMVRLIADIKDNLHTEIAQNNPKLVRLNKLRNELDGLLGHDSLFPESAKEEKSKAKSQKQLEKDIALLVAEVEDIRSNKIYRNAFEWRFEFPEVLNEAGDFVGFDVVIGNPPYVGEKSNKEIFREVKQSSMGEVYQRKMDLFYFFFHLALDLSKIGSQVVFITTNYFPTATSAEKLRKALKKRATIHKFLNLNELKIFESALGQHNMITILSKGYNENIIAENCVTQRVGSVNVKVLEDILSGNDEKTEYYKVLQKNLYEENDCQIRLIGNSATNEDTLQIILENIKKQGKLLGDLCYVNQGILSGIDKITQKHINKFPHSNFVKNQGVYVINHVGYESLKKDTDILKPWFKNSDIHKYYTNLNTEEYLIYVTRDLDIERYPFVYHHLLKYEDAIKARSQDRGEMQAALKSGKWWVIFAARKNINFETHKIVVPQRSYHNTFGYNEVSWYASADVYYITQKDIKMELKYILAVLNSKIYYLWLYYKGKRKGEMLELYQKPLSQIPIKKVSIEQQQPFIKKVNQILAAKKNNQKADTSKLEAEIDQLVYKLYGLTEEEIRIVEG